MSLKKKFEGWIDSMSNVLSKIESSEQEAVMSHGTEPATAEPVSDAPPAWAKEMLEKQNKINTWQEHFDRDFVVQDTPQQDPPVETPKVEEPVEVKTTEAAIDDAKEPAWFTAYKEGQEAEKQALKDKLKTTEDERDGVVKDLETTEKLAVKDPIALSPEAESSEPAFAGSKNPKEFSEQIQMNPTLRGYNRVNRV